MREREEEGKRESRRARGEGKEKKENRGRQREDEKKVKRKRERGEEKQKKENVCTGRSGNLEIQLRGIKDVLKMERNGNNYERVCGKLNFNVATLVSK